MSVPPLICAPEGALTFTRPSKPKMLKLETTTANSAPRTSINKTGLFKKAPAKTSASSSLQNLPPDKVGFPDWFQPNVRVHPACKPLVAGSLSPRNEPDFSVRHRQLDDNGDDDSYNSYMSPIIMGRQRGEAIRKLLGIEYQNPMEDLPVRMYPSDFRDTSSEEASTPCEASLLEGSTNRDNQEDSRVASLPGLDRQTRAENREQEMSSGSRRDPPRHYGHSRGIGQSAGEPQPRELSIERHDFGVGKIGSGQVLAQEHRHIDQPNTQGLQHMRNVVSFVATDHVNSVLWTHYLNCYAAGKLTTRDLPPMPTLKRDFTWLPAPYTPYEESRLAASKKYQDLPKALFKGQIESYIKKVLIKTGASYVGISFIDHSHERYKFLDGLDGVKNFSDHIPRDSSIGAHALLSEEVMVISDCDQDWRFEGNPYVRGGIFKFYAGAPLVSVDGRVVGVLAVWDNKPLGSFKHIQRLELALAAAVVLSEFDNQILLETDQETVIPRQARMKPPESNHIRVSLSHSDNKKQKQSSPTDPPITQSSSIAEVVGDPQGTPRDTSATMRDSHNGYITSESWATASAAHPRPFTSSDLTSFRRDDPHNSADDTGIGLSMSTPLVWDDREIIPRDDDSEEDHETSKIEAHERFLPSEQDTIWETIKERDTSAGRRQDAEDEITPRGSPAKADLFPSELNLASKPSIAEAQAAFTRSAPFSSSDVTYDSLGGFGQQSSSDGPGFPEYSSGSAIKEFSSSEADDPLDEAINKLTDYSREHDINLLYVALVQPFKEGMTDAQLVAINGMRKEVILAINAPEQLELCSFYHLEAMRNRKPVYRGSPKGILYKSCVLVRLTSAAHSRKRNAVILGAARTSGDFTEDEIKHLWDFSMTLKIILLRDEKLQRFSYPPETCRSMGHAEPEDDTRQVDTHKVATSSVPSRRKNFNARVNGPMIIDQSQGDMPSISPGLRFKRDGRDYSGMRPPGPIVVRPFQRIDEATTHNKRAIHGADSGMSLFPTYAQKFRTEQDGDLSVTSKQDQQTHGSEFTPSHAAHFSHTSAVPLPLTLTPRLNRGQMEMAVYDAGRGGLRSALPREMLPNHMPRVMPHEERRREIQAAKANVDEARKKRGIPDQRPEDFS